MLIRGINRQIVVINDTGNELFESAIFIVSEKGALAGNINMAAAAGELLAKCSQAGGIVAKKPPMKKKSFLKVAVLALIVLLIATTIFLLLK